MGTGSPLRPATVKLQGAIASINGVTGLIVPTLFTQAVANFIQPGSALSTQHYGVGTSGDFPGAPFILASLMLLGAAVIRGKRRDNHEHAPATSIKHVH